MKFAERPDERQALEPMSGNRTFSSALYSVAGDKLKILASVGGTNSSTLPWPVDSESAEERCSNPPSAARPSTSTRHSKRGTPPGVKRLGENTSGGTNAGHSKQTVLIVKAWTVGTLRRCACWTCVTVDAPGQTTVPAPVVAATGSVAERPTAEAMAEDEPVVGLESSNLRASRPASSEGELATGRASGGGAPTPPGE